MSAAKRKGTWMSAITRFLGDSPLRVALKLIVVSFLVGLVMSAFGWTPWGILLQIRQLLTDIWNMGFHAIYRLAGYFLLGAAVVVPVFIVLRILSYRRG
jgi:polyferredoxin